MHYYKKNLGEYYKKAGRLSILQHGIYNLLIDACYDRERFPDLSEAVEWCWASTKEEIEAVEFVLGRFFSLIDGVYTQSRIAEELENYHKNAATNKRIAQERETKRKEKKADRERTVNDIADIKNDSPPKQEPRTKNQEPILKDNIPAMPKYDSQDLIFANQMLETILFDNPNFKKPDTKKWAEVIRLMRERDNRSYEDMARIWQWARQDSFWNANILSANKFREQFDKLTAQANRAPTASSNPGRDEVRRQIMDIHDTNW